MIPRPPSSTLFPYTTLFRSWQGRSDRLPLTRRAAGELEHQVRRGDAVDQHVDLRRTKSVEGEDRKSTRLNSSHMSISYAVFCLKKKKYLVSLPDRSTYIFNN